MAIEITQDVGFTAHPAHKYPYLGIFRRKEIGDLIVLFSDKDTGCVVYDGSGRYKVGDWYDEWPEEEYCWYEHKLVLNNV